MMDGMAGKKKNLKAQISVYLRGMKNKILLLCFTLMLTNVLYAAENTEVESYKRLYIGASFTMNVAYRHLAAQSSLAQTTLDMRNKYEKPQWGFQAGPRLGVRATRWLSIETGVDYWRHRYSFRRDGLQFGSQWNGSIYYDSTSQGYSVKSIEDYHYLNVPVALNFSLGKRKLKGIISTGVNLSFLITKKTTYRLILNNDVLESNTVTDNGPYASFNVSPFLGVGVEWHLGKVLFLRLMPVAQMQAMKNVDAPLTEYLWSVGMNASLYFGFVRVK